MRHARISSHLLSICGFSTDSLPIGYTPISCYHQLLSTRRTAYESKEALHLGRRCDLFYFDQRRKGLPWGGTQGGCGLGVLRMSRTLKGKLSQASSCQRWKNTDFPRTLLTRTWTRSWMEEAHLENHGKHLGLRDLLAHEQAEPRPARRVSGSLLDIFLNVVPYYHPVPTGLSQEINKKG